MSTTSDTERTILVAYDFSSASEVAADAALVDLRDSRRGGRLILLHVLLPLHPPIAIESSLLRAGRAEIEQSAKLEMTQRLERVAERLRGRLADAPVELESVVRYGSPAEVVVAFAVERGVDRVYVGAHDKRILLGSVAVRVLRAATVPVLVAHARERVPEVA